MPTNRDYRKQWFTDLELNPYTLATVPAGSDGQIAVVSDQVGQRLYVRIGGTLVPAIDVASSPGVVLLAGRAGGQTIYGGTATTNKLILIANSADTTGSIDVRSPITNSTSYLKFGVRGGVPPVNFDGTSDVYFSGSVYVSNNQYGFRCGGNIQSDLSVIGALVGVNAYAASVGSLTGYGYLQAFENDGMHLPVKEYQGVANNNLILMNSLNMYKNHDHSVSSANPTLIIHSNLDPDTNNTRWGAISHSGTSGAAGSFDIRSGSGPLIFGTTTTPPSGFADTGDVATGGDWYVAGSYALGKKSIFVPSSVNSVAASTGITSSMLDKTLIKIQGDGGAVNITADPQIADGVDGQVIILKGDHNTNTVQIDDGTGVALNNGTAFVMGKGDVLKLYYDSTDDIWYEISRSKNS